MSLKYKFNQLFKLVIDHKTETIPHKKVEKWKKLEKAAKDYEKELDKVENKNEQGKLF